MDCFMRPPLLALASLLLLSCGPEPFERDGQDGEDLPLGEIGEMKDDGWGFATQCKAIPDRTPLTAPRITISLNGLTLHLVDDASGLSRVYPIGVGSINHNVGEKSYGNSLSLYPVLATQSNAFTIRTNKVNPCKIWWTDKETGKTSPVFAGLPFLPWWNSYGIHGPVTGYTAPNGGQLKRGYVSHGCIRMEAADVAELWAHVRDVSEVPVWVQKEIERTPDGTAVDLPQRWILSECAVDEDCNYDGGVCLPNASSGRGFCSAKCDRLCYHDKYGYPVTFCVEDAAGAGYCTYKHSDFNYSCKRFDSFEAVDDVPRFSQPSVTADVCLPQSL
jgi:hypothetical protein